MRPQTTLIAVGLVALAGAAPGAMAACSSFSDTSASMQDASIESSDTDGAASGEGGVDAPAGRDRDAPPKSAYMPTAKKKS